MNKCTSKICIIDGKNHNCISDIEYDLVSSFGYEGFDLSNIDALADTFPYNELLCVIWNNARSSYDNCFKYTSDVISILNEIEDMNYGFHLFVSNSDARNIDEVVINGDNIHSIEEFVILIKECCHINSIGYFSPEDMYSYLISYTGEYKHIVLCGLSKVRETIGANFDGYYNALLRVNKHRGSIRFSFVNE